MIEGAINQMIVDMLSEIEKDIHDIFVEQMRINPDAIEALYK